MGKTGPIREDNGHLDQQHEMTKAEGVGVEGIDLTAREPRIFLSQELKRNRSSAIYRTLADGPG